jgi:hypothetical protein
MELIGQAIYTALALGASTLVALFALLFRPLRRFIFAIVLTPPVSVFFLFLCRWVVIDNAPVCGTNPEWDRCPSATSNWLGWTVWLVGTVAIGIGAYWAQRAVQAAIRLWFDSKPMSLFSERPRWSR